MTNRGIEDVEKRILAGLAERFAFGITDVPQEDVLSFAGYAYPTAPRFHQAKKSLMAKGLIEYGNKIYRLTDKGLAQSPASAKKGMMGNEQPKSNEEFHQALQEQFKEAKTSELFMMLIDGRPHDRLSTCNTLGYKFQTAPAFAKAVAELKKYKLLETAGKGLFQLTEKAFPCGRP